MAAPSFADKFTTTPLVSERYSDFYINLNRNYGTKDIARQTNDQAIISALKNIIFTRKGERPFQPEFGCDVLNMLFENFNHFTAETLQTEVRTAVENFEPRVQTIDVAVEEDQDNHAFTMYLYFTTINNPETTSVSFLLTRIR